MFDDAQKEPEDIFEQTDQAAPQVPPPTQPEAAPAPAEPAPVPATPEPAPAPTPEPAAQPEAAADQASYEEQLAAYEQQKAAYEAQQQAAASAPAPEQVAAPEPQVYADPAQAMSGADYGDAGKGNWKAIMLVAASILVIVAAFFISMKILGSRGETTPEPPEELSPTIDVIEDDAAVIEEEPVVEPEPEEEEEEPVIEEEPEEEEVDMTDSDKDGLTDLEEAVLGTSPESPDTDGDGLYDYEEAMTWQTDPLNPDTDGDGFQDGAEVSGGYDPNGDGELLTVPDEEDDATK